MHLKKPLIQSLQFTHAQNKLVCLSHGYWEERSQNIIQNYLNIKYVILCEP